MKAPRLTRVLLDDDFRGSNYYDAVVAVKALNARSHPVKDSAVVIVLHQGDKLVLRMDGGLAQDTARYLSVMAINEMVVPGAETLLALENVYAYKAVAWVYGGYLIDFQQRPYLSPDPEAVG